MQVVPRFRRILLMAGALVAALVLAACGSGAGGKSGSGGGSYKVVLISDLSGPYSGVSGPGAVGAEVAIDNINATGGINGKHVNLEVIDSQSAPAAALAAAQKAVSENPLAVIMFSGSAGASSITSLVQSTKVPFLSPALADTSVYPAQPYLYQPSLTAKQDAQALYQFVKQKLNGALSGKTVDVAAITSPYVDVIIKNATTLLQADGAKIGSTERYQLPLASFTTQAGAISRDRPDAVLVLGSTDDTVVVSKALKAAGVTSLQVGIPSGAAQTTVQHVASPNYYALTANPYPSALPDFLSIADKYGKKADVSGSIFSMSGWVTAYVVAHAVTQCGASCDSAHLNAALEQVSNYTVPNGVSYGPVTFSASNHIAASTVRFHSYDPATGRFSESDPITVQAQ
jgi:branched-chain amino acid transport system substrate-binding protein